MNRHSSSIIVFFIGLRIAAIGQVANFIIPDSVCVGQDIVIQNTSTGATTYYWNFCSGNLATNPVGANSGNLGGLNGPVYSAIAKDGTDFFVFITNVNDGTLTRLAYGNSMTNTPVAKNLGSLGVLLKNIEGIQINKDSLTGNWFGFIAGGENRFLIRLSFGNSLNNDFPVAADLGNISGLMSYSHTIYTFREGANWYMLMVNSDRNNILRLDFGNSLKNPPTAVDLGNVGGLSEPVGFYPIEENDLWSLFVVNKNNNSISRLDFGSSLLNNPTGVKLGNIGNKLAAPRSITILRDCGQVFGFIVNEIPDDIVRLTFPNGLLSKPSAESLGNIANFDFPHHISELFRVGDSLYTYIMNVNNSTISRLCFASCNNSSVSSSILQNPAVYSYSSPGTYNVSLVIDEGLPTQSNICREIVATGVSTPLITGDSAICSGETLTLIAESDSGYLYKWTGPNGYATSSPDVIITNSDTSNAGVYSLTVSLAGCLSDTVNKPVTVTMSPIVNLGNDTILCQGAEIILNAGNSGSNYTWNTGPLTQTISVSTPGNYSVTVTVAECSASDTILVEDCGSELWFPNVFSPDNDSKNDTFNPVSQGFIFSYHIQIFNRWGQQIYESDDAKNGWDGTLNGNPCPEETYAYIVRYSMGTGLSSGKEIVKRGTVSILR
jgi:gliding motility-associated-like protein